MPSGFELPDIQSKTIAPSTKKLYKFHLNQLAKAGYKTISDLQTHATDVVKLMREMHTTENKQKQRIVYSAVFYALADTDYIKRPNPYHAEFQKHKDAIPPAES